MNPNFNNKRTHAHVNAQQLDENSRNTKQLYQSRHANPAQATHSRYESSDYRQKQAAFIQE